MARRGGPSQARQLVGRDLARMRAAAGRSARGLPFLLVGGLLAGLSLAALRIDILRLGYAVADAVAEEKALMEQRGALTARVQALRDPARLASLASARGLARPTRVIELQRADLVAGSHP
jgi:hypothetical protein